MITKLTAEQEETFRNLRDALRDGDDLRRYDLRSLAQEIRPELTDAEFDRGWQFCSVTGKDYHYSLAEFLRIINQTF